MQYHQTIRSMLYRNILITSCMLLLGACHDNKVAYSPDLKRNNLVKLVFPTYPEQTIQQVSSADNQSAWVKVELLHVVQLDQNHAMLLTRNEPVDEQGNAMCGYISGSAVGAYIFTHDEQGWKLNQRQDEVATFGASCGIGKTSVVKGGNEGFVLVANWQTCFQGNCGSWLEFTDLKSNGAHYLGSIYQAAWNAGFAPECGAIDGKPEAENENEKPIIHECFQVNSQWSIKEKQIKMAFDGWLKSADQPPKVTMIKQKAIYEIQEDQLKLVSGTNPVPGF